ncbi:MAG: cysteine hydrolase [Acidobacteria bacterium]|nr:cysteine hydrolase [Acidobacteriota bacterium]
MTKTALLAMDFQNGIASRFPGNPVFAQAGKALAAARKAGHLVVYVRVAFRPDFAEVSPANKAFGKIASRAGSMSETETATAVIDQLAPQQGDVVVVKRRFSAFAGSDLEMVLRAQGITDLVISGVSTSGVVLSTIRQAADLDYRLTVLEDACADGDEEVHRVLMEKVFPRQADVTSVEEWMSAQ